MTIRNYSSRAQQTTLSGALAAGATLTTVISGSNLMGGVTPASSTYTVVIDPDTTLEEIVDITAVSGNNITIVRGIDGSSDVAHSAGAIVRHMVTGRDLREANNHSENVTSAHGLTIANVVSTTNSGSVTSTMIANDTIVDADINTAAAIAWTKIAPSSTVSATELGYLDGVTSAIQTQIDAKLATATASSTYAPLASPTLTGVPVAPTAAANTNTTQIATTAYVQTELSDLLASAPAALDTLNELAAALGNDANFATTTANSIAAKLPLAGGTMTGAIAMGTHKITGLDTPTAGGDATNKTYVDGVLVAPSNLTGPITSTGVATAIASQTGTGTKFVMDTSPTLVTPALGVATATSVNGTTIPTSKTLVVTTDKLSALAGTTSAELAGVISDETGSGPLVFATSPTLTTPNLGTPSAINLTNATAVPADSGKTDKSTLTTTGDIYYASSANTPARLAVGSTGDVLTVAGGVPTWAAPAGGGKVVQVVTATYGTYTTSATNSYVDTGLSATITPSSSSNKVLVFLSQNGCYKGTADTWLQLILLRNTTQVGPTFADRAGNGLSTTPINFGSISADYLDSPAQTAAVTYKTQFQSGNNVSLVGVQHSAASSTIVLMEVTP